LREPLRRGTLIQEVVYRCDLTHEWHVAGKTKWVSILQRINHDLLYIALSESYGSAIRTLKVDKLCLPPSPLTIPNGLIQGSLGSANRINILLAVAFDVDVVLHKL
jgi:hypothetical protein